MYLGIEGSSYTGKTSAGLELEKRGHLFIPEYDKQMQFPYSYKTIDGLKAIIDELLYIEARRTEQLSITTMHEYVFSDRTPISFLTFEDMKIHTAKNTEDIDAHRRVKDYAMVKLGDAIEAGNIVMPDVIVVLKISNQKCFYERVSLRGLTAVKELADHDIQHHIAKKSFEYAVQYVGIENSHTIEVDKLTVKDVTEDLENIAARDVV